MAFPPVRTLIGFPYPATASLVAGSSFRDIYWPLGNLTDGSGKTAWRCANMTGSVRLDLGSVLPVNFFAVFGHNFDADAIVGVSTTGGIAVTRGVGVKQPAFWLDLRALDGTSTTARFIDIAWAGNSRPVTIGEICVGHAYEFTGMIDGEPTEQLRVPQRRAPLEYGKLVVSAPGSMSRTMELRLSMDPDQRELVEDICAQAAASPISQPLDGTRVVVVPSTHRNDAWYVEWPPFLEEEFEQSASVVRASLPLNEEVFGVR